ncbi:MAG: tetratricopeptide repeat protein [Gammaproteobacteria bacterium]
MDPSDTHSPPPGLFARLKQHHIYRVAVGYGTAIAIGIQVVARAFPYFGWSAAVPAVIIVLIASFPVALVLAWLLVKPTDLARQTVWQKRHWKLGAIVTPVVIAAVVISGIYAFHFSERYAARMAAEQITQVKPVTPAFNPPSDTIVVLPFTNLSGDPKQQYFSDGITEELTDALGQNPALRVIAWEAASKYRNSGESATTIGKALDVANILHGSIVRAGDQVRITAELVDARSGYQIWSQHYDDSFANIFKVQDEVSQAIAAALQVKFAQADLPISGTINPAAHDLVLKGRALADKFDAASLAAARRDFEQAIALDPEYADGHAWLAHVLLALTERSDLPLAATLPTIRAEAEKALALDPRNADAWVALGNVNNSTDPPDFAKAREAYRKALALDPSNVAAHVDYGTVLPLKQAFAQTQEATLLDPANATAWNNLAGYAQDLGNWAQELQAAQNLLRLDPQDVDSAFSLAFAYQQLHRDDQIASAFAAVKPATDIDRQQIAAGRLTYRALADPKLRPRALAALEALSRHASNQDVAGNLLQMYLALGETASALQLLETSCPATPVGCNDLAVNPMYLALRADPRFRKLARTYTTATLTAAASAASNQ